MRSRAARRPRTSGNDPVLQAEADATATFDGSDGMGTALLEGADVLEVEVGLTSAEPTLQQAGLAPAALDADAAAERLDALVQAWLESDDVVATAATVEDAIEGARCLQGVTSAETAREAAEWVRTLRQARLEAVAYFGHVREPAHRVWKQVVAAQRACTDPTEEQEGRLRRLVGRWEDEQERLRRTEAEARRATQEAAERAEREAQATVAEAQGAQAEAEAIRNAPSTVPPVTVMPAPKARGVSRRESWKAEVTDLHALVQAVAAGDVPMQAITADMSFLGKQARALKDALAYPGVRAYNEPTAVVR